MCASGRFGVHLFQGDLGVAAMDRLEAVGTHWQARNPGKRVELVLVLPSNSRMSPEERSRMTQLMRRGDKDRLASATVILAEGLRGALHRSVLTGLMMIAPAPHPMKVFGNIEDAVTYLMPYLETLPAPPPPSAILQSVVELYEAFDKR
jgi:hypothetical protein